MIKKDIKPGTKVFSKQDGVGTFLETMMMK